MSEIIYTHPTKGRVREGIRYNVTSDDKLDPEALPHTYTLLAIGDLAKIGKLEQQLREVAAPLDDLQRITSGAVPGERDRYLCLTLRSAKNPEALISHLDAYGEIVRDENLRETQRQGLDVRVDLFVAALTAA